MKIFFLLLTLSSLAQAYNCPHSVNPNSIIYFVDTRNSTHEVNSAQIAACERGETLIRMSPPINKNTFKNNLSGLARANRAVSSVIISGHDGGGRIHNDDGDGLDKFEAIGAIKEAYRGKPALLAQLKSAFLWGCWSNGPAEVGIWRSELPSLKLIGGFIDMAPINTATASHTVLEGLLRREREIETAKNVASLRRSISSVENINQTYAAVYAESCGQNMYYYNKAASYYGEEDPNMSGGTHFTNFDTAFRCESLSAADKANIRRRIMGYYLGNTPIPADTSHGDLRNLYMFARNNSRCLFDDNMFNADRLLMLTFFPEVKKNFSATFSADIDAGVREFNSLLTEVNSSGINTWDIPGYRNLGRIINEGKNAFFTPKGATLDGKNRQQIRSMISYLHSITANPAMEGTLLKGRLPAIRLLQQRMENYLYQLNPNCMDFLQWHEYQAGRRPAYSCGR